jgi:predicted dehydrogenase
MPDAHTTRWGILGTGSIARKFAEGLKSAPGAELVAVGSRAQKTADEFGERFDVPRRHASYEALAADADVDAIYVSSPHSCHKDNTIQCLEAGKPVLCEKPFAINAGQAEAMVAVARERGVFLMEAMWTRFEPVTVKVREWLASGAIGEPRMLCADFGFRAGANPRSRLFDPALGAGALLDVGVYPVSYGSMVFGGPPDHVAGLATMHEDGFDEQSAFVLGYPGGELAVLYCAIRTTTVHRASIMGTEGRIEIPTFWKAQEATLFGRGSTEHVERPFAGNGYEYEAAEVGRCLREGKLESDTVPLDETLAIMQTLDRIRGQWGMTYPME